MRFLLLMATIAVFLTGCASSGPTGKEILTGSIAPQQSRLVIYRTSAMGYLIQPNYLVDGKPVGASQPKGFVVCNLDPGPHKVGVDNTEFNVNFGGGSDKSDINLKPGETKYLEARPQMGLTVGVITLVHVTEEQGRADTAELYKLESACA